jgi:hypothetical protein
MLAALGEDRAANVGDVLYRIATGCTPSSRSLKGRWRSLTRWATRSPATGIRGFSESSTCLSGQTVFVTAVVTRPLRYIAVDRDALRPLLFEDGPLSDLLVSTFITRRELLQAFRASAWRCSGRLHLKRRCRCSSSRGATACRSRGAIRSARTTHLRPSWPPGSMRHAARAPAGRHAAARTDRRPGLPGARNRPRAGAARGGRPSGCRRGARRPRRRGLRRIRGTRHADHRQHGARRAGGRLPADRGLPRIPSRDQRLGADEPCGHARAKGSAPGWRSPTARFRSKLETDATSCDWRTTARSPRWQSRWRLARSTAACRLRGSPDTRA